MATKVGFNYRELPDQSAAEVAKDSARQINQLLEKSGDSVIQIGRLLIAVKERLTPAIYKAWLECEFGWVQSTESNYMQAARLFGDLDCVKQFQPTPLIMLSRKSIPESVVKAAIAKARAGERITFSIVAGLLKQAGHKPKPKPRSSVTSSVASAIESVDQLTLSLDTLSQKLVAMSLPQNDRNSLAQKLMAMASELMKPVEPPRPAGKATGSKSPKTTGAKSGAAAKP